MNSFRQFAASRRDAIRGVLTLFLGVTICTMAFAQSSVPAANAALSPPSGSSTPVAANGKPCPPLLNRSFKKLQDESDQSLCQWAGKVILVVNTASYCGFTAQYEGLEAMYKKYPSKDFVILGFPSNDFSQEPKGNKEIADFCYNTYGVAFPMFAKTSVVGKEANPLYVDLHKATNKRPSWNFFKYLIDRNGNVVAAYASIVTPTDKTLVNEVDKLIAQQ